MTRRRATVMLSAATAGALFGCPSLGEIGVGGSDAGADRVAPVDVAPREARSADVVDVVAEPKACTPDAASDPKNCGRCGHDCGGGACTAGACQPYAIVTGDTGPWGVAVAGKKLFFTSQDGFIKGCSVDDCMNTLVDLTSGQGFPRGITTDATNVYWANEGFVVDAGFAGGVATCGLRGCPKGVATVLAAAEQAPFDLTVNASSAFWTDQYGKLVRSCSIGGCSSGPTTLATDPTVLSGVAIDATSIYWAEPKLGNIIQCPLGGCASLTPFASGQVNPLKLDVAYGTLFWSANGAIMSCMTSGCMGAPQVFASGQPASFAITHDATHLYWTLFALAGKVMSCPLAGCTAPTVLADMQAQPSTLAVDDSSVYWANSGGGTIMRVMK